MGKSIKKKTFKKRKPQIQENKFITLFNKSWKVIIAIGIITAFIVNLQSIKNLFLTQKEKYDKENFKTGKIEPAIVLVNSTKIEKDKSTSLSEKAPVFNSSALINSLPKVNGILIRRNGNAGINFMVGNGLNTIFFNQLDSGVQIDLSSISGNPNNCNGSVMYFLTKDNRLYVSAEFKDLQKEEHIGIIEYNRWRIYKPNLLNWDEDDHRLEVRDKQNLIVFSVSSVGNSIVVAGYFINPTSIFILTNQAFSPPFLSTCILKSTKDWKQMAEVKISKIISIFSKEYHNPF